MKALVVDDHSLFRHGLEMLLQIRMHFTTVLQAESRDEALALLAENSDVDIALLDYNLGKDNGLALMSVIKARHPQLKVLIMSGEIHPELILKSLGEGAMGFLPKNLTPAELADSIALVLQGEIYVPTLPKSSDNHQIEAAVEQAKVQHLGAIAEVARRVVRDGDLSLRLDEDDSEITSSFNQLLSELERERNVLKDMAFRDELTGLANRRMFIERAESGLKLARRNGELMGLVYLDIDNFKTLNDTFGHDSGDTVLKAFAQRLELSVRDVDLVARLGGDEFVIVITSTKNASDLRIVLDRLLENIRIPVVLNERDQWFPESSIGAALSSGDEALESLMARADSAMYQVKSKGKNDVCIVSLPE